MNKGGRAAIPYAMQGPQQHTQRLVVEAYDDTHRLEITRIILLRVTPVMN